MTLHPQIIQKEGRNEFVVLPYQEYIAVEEALEDLQDLQTLAEAREAHASEQGIPLADIGKRLGF